MKIPLGVILILNAVAAFDGIAAAAPPCDTTAMSKLLVTANVRTCRTDSGYNPTSMASPTDAQINAVCNSDACMKATDSVKQVAPNECTVGPVRLYANVIDPLMQRCGKSGSAGSVSVSGSGSGPAAGDVGNVSGPAAGTTATSKPRTNTPASTPGNGATDAPTLSTFAAIAVLAMVVAAIF